MSRASGSDRFRRCADPRFRPRPPDDNRWQRGSVLDAVYFAADEETLWAEWYRHLAERGLPPLRQLPRELWRFRVMSLSVADLTNEERLGRLGLPLPMPGRTTWPAHQRVGAALWREGWPGLLAPSAARPSGLVLCLFVAAGLPHSAEPISPPLLVLEPPVPPTGMRT